MTRIRIGRDSTGVACVKITKGNINPYTEPDANRSSFYYNSKWPNDVKLTLTDSTPFQTGSRYVPSNANINNYQKVLQAPYVGSAAVKDIGVRNTFFGDALTYSLPLFDVKRRRLSDGKYTELLRVRREGNEGYGGAEPGYFETSDRGQSAWWEDRPDASSNSFDVIGALGAGLLYPGHSYGTADANLIEKEVIVWRLPGDNTALRDAATKAPVAGQKSIEINKSYCRVAKPGYDVRTASDTQLAFDSSGRPLASIAADDINLPAGVSQYELGIAVTANTLADLFLYVDDVITFPMSRFGRALVAEYWFSGTKLYIDNKQSTACRCRFVVFANDRAPLSSGSYNVIRKLSVGGENVVQFLRPGAGNPPALRDIVLDSRWPALQILAEGYQSIAAVGEREPPGGVNAGQSFSVDFNSAGFFPIIKYMTVHQHRSFGKCVKFPQTLITENYNGDKQYHQANSTYCQLSNSRATFYTFNGNPYAERYNDKWVFDYVPDPIVGIRYFILGIAT
ncbi:hypothetical protein [Rhizobium sp. NFR12]|uniref:hypothetical protein n=1 Tax=Rhizobium sp. NFR12 TaxID=1566261 RepID=UPI0008A74E50|nr:hypothetical protein [Rhizobium sp. NFR12]SEH22520.1 hypothetical protein SAMN03159407_1164 [Rhizobium sp. NFR12]